MHKKNSPQYTQIMVKKQHEFLPFAEFVRIVTQANIISQADYHYRYKQISDKIPSHPEDYYKEWEGWKMFTGNGIGGDRRTGKVIMCYNKAKALIEKYNLKTSTEYQAVYKKISPNLPASPPKFYEKFPGWNAFLTKSSKRKIRGKMKTKFSFTIKGIPESWNRAGINRKNYSIYDTNKAYKKRVWTTIKDHEKENHENPDLYNSMIKIKVAFFMPIARYNKNKIKIGTPHNKVPDLDNLIKLVLDIFSKHIIHDDHQVVELNAKKEYSDNPRTEVEYEALIEDTEISSDAKLSRQNKILKFKKPSYAKSALFD